MSRVSEAHSAIYGQKPITASAAYSAVLSIQRIAIVTPRHTRIRMVAVFNTTESV